MFSIALGKFSIALENFPRGLETFPIGREKISRLIGKIFLTIERLQNALGMKENEA